MTDTTDEALRGLIERATKGPWEHPYGVRVKGDGRFIACCDVLCRSLKNAGLDEAMANAALIVAAVNVLPKHLNTIAELRARVEASEVHRNDLADKIVMQKVEIGSLKHHLDTRTEQRDHALTEVAKLRARAEESIPMLLWCPQCNAQHVDEASEGWDNPPHRSHLCHACGCIWRPADVATVGVVDVKTAGEADTWGWIGGYSLLPPLGERLAAAEAEVAKLREAAEPFISHYDPEWMADQNDHPNDRSMSVSARVTFGQLRALVAALRTYAPAAEE